jgi:hypothetical protein
MLRKTLVVLLSLTFIGIGGGLTLSGCSDKSEAQGPPPKPAARMPTGRDAVIGQWVKGRRRLTLNANNTFTWMLLRPCAAPPCKMMQMGGTWSIGGGNINLTLANGKSLSVGYRHAGPPRTLWINNRMYNTKVTYNRAN